MNLIINGENRDSASLTVGALLVELGLEPKITIVEKNQIIIKQADYSDEKLNEGDVLELVRFMGGG